MNTILLIPVVVLVMAAFGLGLYAFIRFDDALCRLYETDKERWKRIGAPMGFIWSPADRSSFLQATESRNELFAMYVRVAFRRCSFPRELPQID